MNQQSFKTGVSEATVVGAPPILRRCYAEVVLRRYSAGATPRLSHSSAGFLFVLRWCSSAASPLLPWCSVGALPVLRRCSAELHQPPSFNTLSVLCAVKPAYNDLFI